MTNPKVQRYLHHTLSCLLLTIALIAPAQAQTMVSASVSADVPRAQAWEYLKDFSLAHMYVPGISRVEIISTQQSGVGAHRHVYDMDGDYIEETITEWREGEGFLLRLHEGEDAMPPFDDINFRYQLADAENEQTLINVSMDFVMPLGGFGQWLGGLLIAPFMEDQLALVAAGMKHFYETGERASDADRERLLEAVSITSPEDG